MDLLGFFGFLSPEFITVILSGLPFTELRGSIPLAIFYFHLSPIAALFFALVGNIAAGALVVIFLEPLAAWARKYFKFIDIFLNWWSNKVYAKFLAKYQKYGPVALIAFVAVPLPGTGAWTGAVAAWLFKIKRNSALIYIITGVIIAGILVTAISVGAIKGLSFLI